MQTINRRQFVKTSAGAAAVFTAVTGPKAAVAANEKIVVGVMGLGGRGTFVAERFAERKDVEIAYLCDVNTARFGRAREAVEEAQGRRVKTE